MNTRQPFKDAYLRFLQLLSTVEKSHDIQDFEPNERALFDSLCLCWSQGKPLTVREAIGQTPMGSPATLHKRLQRLIDKSMIETHTKEGDRRTKYLHPSEKGLAYIEWLGTQLISIQT
jgi:DNA-binding MarR family transcriptional regulator